MNDLAPGRAARRARPGLLPALAAGRAAFVMALLAGASPALAGSGSAAALVPLPREIATSGSFAALAGAWRIRLEVASLEDRRAAELLADEASASLGHAWTIATEGPSRRAISIGPLAPSPGDPPLFREQGYVLTITPESIAIRGATCLGRFYGVQTLRQMLRGARSGRLPCAVIRDYPELAWRGVSDDISRGQISTLADFKDIVRRLAYYKLNLYQPYIEDLFAFRSDTAIGRAHGALTEAEIREIVAEGSRNHVAVVPIFQTLGHQSRLLSLGGNRRLAEMQDLSAQPWTTRTAFPKLKGAVLGLFGGPAPDPVEPWSFSPALPESREYVGRLVDELAVLCPGPFFHIGGDEASDLGKGMSKPLAQRIGVGGVLVSWITHFDRRLRERHHRPAAVYSDGLLKYPRAAAQLPRDVVVVDWHYDPDGPFDAVGKLQRAGFSRILISPALWNWSSFYPNYPRAFANIAAFSAVGRRARVLGSVTASWGDDGSESLRHNNWPGYAFAAQSSWSPESTATDAFLGRFAVTEFGEPSGALARAEKLIGWQEFEHLGWYGRLYHRRPHLRPRGDAWLARLQALDRDMTEARALLAAARAGARRHAEEIDLLDHAARRFHYIARREIDLDALARRLGGGKLADLAPGERRDAIDTLRALRGASGALASDYRSLWLRTNKPQSVGAVLIAMARQTRALDGLIGDATAGTLKVETLGARVADPAAPAERGEGPGS